MRVGGGHNARLSIPRDTVVDIPGHGRNKINAAYAFGGAALAIQTVEAVPRASTSTTSSRSTSTNFPRSSTRWAASTTPGGCVVSKINGGFKQRRLHAAAPRRAPRTSTASRRSRSPARARTSATPRENDLTRARRQQKIFAAMKSRLLSPAAFVRAAVGRVERAQGDPTDMSGPTLLGPLRRRWRSAGTPPTRVLKPSGVETLPDGGRPRSSPSQERRARCGASSRASPGRLRTRRRAAVFARLRCRTSTRTRTTRSRRRSRLDALVGRLLLGLGVGLVGAVAWRTSRAPGCGLGAVVGVVEALALEVDGDGRGRRARPATPVSRVVVSGSSVISACTSNVCPSARRYS